MPPGDEVRAVPVRRPSPAGVAGCTATRVPAAGPLPSAALLRARCRRPRGRGASAAFSTDSPARAVLPVVQIGAADAAVGDLDDGLVRRGRRHRHGLDAHVARAVRDDGGVSVGMVLMFAPFVVPVGWSDDDGHAAVDEDDLTVDEVGSVGGEPQRRADEVIDGAPAVRGGAAEDPLVEAVSSTSFWVISVWM